MAWTPYQTFLAILLVVTGSLNTLTTKWADKIESKSADGIVRPFSHPFTQSLFMFLGESFCWVVFKILYCCAVRKEDGSENSNALVKGNRDFRVSIFFIPAMCDMIATSMMYVGLTLTYASSFQMLRGALIPFVAMLSVGFLNTKINSRQWTGIFIIVLGLVVVGLADFIHNTETRDTNSVITGDLLIITAQIISATQMVCEQHFVSGQDVPPLQAVGWEGMFGFIVLAFLHIPLYYINIGPPFSNNPHGNVEDFYDFIVQVSNNRLLLVPLLGTVFSIAFFNFAGLSVTKENSAATRTVLDSVRTLFIWIVSVGVGWQLFSGIQVVGFIILLLGMCCYYDIFITKMIRSLSELCCRQRASGQELLIDQPADETGS